MSEKTLTLEQRAETIMSAAMKEAASSGDWLRVWRYAEDQLRAVQAEERKQLEKTGTLMDAAATDIRSGHLTRDGYLAVAELLSGAAAAIRGSNSKEGE